MTPAWRVAAALALACGLDWGRWARSRRPNPNCDLCWGRGGERDGDVPDQWYPCECLRPVADPFNVDAYLADCARRGVEPGPLPSLEYATREVAWVVAPERDGTVDYVAVRAGGGIEVSTQEDHPQWSVCPNSMCTAADLALLSTLVTAAAAALETTDG